MDLRTFRRNGPGLAECESQAAWRRLWADRRAHRSLDTRGPVSNVAASWPQFGYRGQTRYWRSPTLYYAAPNVKQPKFRWISVGAGVAILAWILASVLFGFYVGNFGSYNKTYGALAGVIVFLLWLWITNLALLFGAELDAELERGRQLQAGIIAERDLQLPPRDSRVTEKNQAKEERDVEQGRALRQSGGQHS